MRKWKPKGREIDGIFLLDKPVGRSSNDALQRVKRIFRAEKAGHTGSLDSLASGMLPICLGEATKIAGFMLDADKRYQMVCTLGKTTTTGDAEGDVVETRPVPALTRSKVETVLSQLTGAVEQTPPMYSAIKHEGQPLYKLARQGIEIAREPRAVTIYHIILQEMTENQLTVEVSCSKGTYMRVLAEDIGKALGCGAFVSQLRRLTVGNYTEEGMVTFETLETRAQENLMSLDSLLLPMESALSHWPSIRLNSDMTVYVSHGQAVQVPHPPTEGLVCLFDHHNRFLGVGQVLDNGLIAPKRLINYH